MHRVMLYNQKNFVATLLGKEIVKFLSKMVLPTLQFGASKHQKSIQVGNLNRLHSHALCGLTILLIHNDVELNDFDFHGYCLQYKK